MGAAQAGSGWPKLKQEIQLKMISAKQKRGADTTGSCFRHGDVIHA
jgi:hypothetical protein